LSQRHTIQTHQSSCVDTEMPLCHRRVRIVLSDDFALLGDAELPTHGAGGLRANGAKSRGVAASRRRAALAVKEGQFDAVLRSARNQLFLGLKLVPCSCNSPRLGVGGHEHTTNGTELRVCVLMNTKQLIKRRIGQLGGVGKEEIFECFQKQGAHIHISRRCRQKGCDSRLSRCPNSQASLRFCCWRLACTTASTTARS